MSAILTTVLGPLLGNVLESVVDKITNQLPVTENEKENIKQKAQKELAEHAGTIADAEATISSNAKDVWLEELHNGGFLATTWRPLLAVVCTFLVLWDGMLLNVLNAMIPHPIAHTPAYTAEIAMWVLLTLIGARGFEKIAVVKAKGK